MIYLVTAVKLSCEAPGCDAAVYERDADAAQEPGQGPPLMTLCPKLKDMATT